MQIITTNNIPYIKKQRYFKESQNMKIIKRTMLLTPLKRMIFGPNVTNNSHLARNMSNLSSGMEDFLLKKSLLPFQDPFRVYDKETKLLYWTHHYSIPHTAVFENDYTSANRPQFQKLCVGRFTHSNMIVKDPYGNLVKPIFISNVDFTGKTKDQYFVLFSKPVMAFVRDFKSNPLCDNYLNKPEVKTFMDSLCDPITKNYI